MNYPLISEYVEAIKLAEENLDQLSYLRPVINDDGLPVMSNGNFATVFKMRDERDGKFYALKCFIKDQNGRNEAYKQIADELEFVSSEFIIPIKFFEKELFVNTSNSDETEFPVLLMDWVEGVTLDKYVRAHLHDQYALQLVSFQFCRIAAWLMAQPFAHGDLKPDNILVKEDGSLTLVDYDGMFVPAMRGQKAREIGSPDYRHPLRTINDFNEHIDDFSLATIAVQLYAIALKPDLLTATQGDALLLTEADYRSLDKSLAMPELFSIVSHSEFAKLLGLFFIAFSENSLSNVSFLTFNISEPIKPVVINLSTEVTDDDIVKGIKDESGALYSQDGKRLLRGTQHIYSQIKPGTQVICDKAFFLNLCYFSSITIPDSVTHIGEGAFSGDQSLTSVIIPNSVTYIGNRAFSGCGNLSSIQVSSGNKTYDSRENCNAIIHTATNTLIAGCENTIIPDTVTHIGDCAFWGRRGLSSIIIPNSITHIGTRAFSYCSGLTSIQVSSDNKTYDSRENCNAIIHKATKTLIAGCKNTIIPKSVPHIGDSAFWGRKGMSSITIPDTVTHIGDYAFFDCRALTEITIPNSVIHIGYGAFYDCFLLKSITLPISITHIEAHTFNNCWALTTITIPDSVTHIGGHAFSSCYRLKCIIIPNSVTHIGNNAFAYCTSLTNITLPDSITHIGEDAFCGCDALAEIRIPVGSFKKFKELLPGLDGKFIENPVSINVTDEDLANGIKDEHGVLYSPDGKRLLRGVNTTSYSIKPETRVICDRAFWGCYNMTKITIPDSVTHIGDRAFSGCLGLTSIAIPNTVTHIGSYTFYECTNLTNITIPNSVTHIGNGAFQACI